MAAPHNAQFAVSLGVFEGPFDLLLDLISRHELDITQVALSRVTDEFIAYLKQLDEHDELEKASEFMVVAATLLDLKIASLLPRGEVVDAEDIALLEARDLLFARLLQYRAFKEVSGWFQSALDAEARRIPRDVRLEQRFQELRPELVWTMSATEFAALAEDALRPKEPPQVALSHLHAPAVSIREQAALVVDRLRAAATAGGERLTFRSLIQDAKERPVVVARFLAVLELYRLGALGFEQQQALDELTIYWREENSFDYEMLANLGADYDA